MREATSQEVKTHVDQHPGLGQVQRRDSVTFTAKQLAHRTANGAAGTGYDRNAHCAPRCAIAAGPASCDRITQAPHEY